MWSEEIGARGGEEQANGPDRSLLVVLPTYNECDNLRQLLPALWDQLPRADVLVIDDDSPDGTAEWCQSMRSSEPRLRLIVRRGQRGLGSATMTALRWGLDQGYAVLATMDGDLSHDPADLARMLNAFGDVRDGRQAADVVIGSRYVPGGRIAEWSWPRRLVSRATNWAARRLIGSAVRDATSALRVYRATALAQIDLDAISSAGFGYLEEILWQLARSGATIVEHPITFRRRGFGASKTSLREGVAVWAGLVRLRLAGSGRGPRG